MAVSAVFTCNADGGQVYNAMGRRDPFVPLVGVADTGIKGGLEGIASIDDVFLQGVTSETDGTRSVIINGEIVSEGQRVNNLFVESVGSNEVILVISEQRHILKLYE